MGPSVSISKHLGNLPTYLNGATTVSSSMSHNSISKDALAEPLIPILRELTFHAPFVFKNCLPLSLTLVIESAGLYMSRHVAEADSIFAFEVNTAHDLLLTLNVPGFLPALVKLPNTTALSVHQKEGSQEQLVFIETMELLPDLASGHAVYTKTERVFNMMSGAREFSVYVPFWVYNYSGVSLGILYVDGDSSTGNENQVKEQVIASSTLPGEECSFITESCGLQTVLDEPDQKSNRVYTHGQFCGTMAKRSVGGGKIIISCTPSGANSPDTDNANFECCSGKPYVYSPSKDMEASDTRLQVRMAFSCSGKGLSHTEGSQARWSRPFSVNPPGGMTTIFIPAQEKEEGLILSVVSASIAGACAGKTRTITFQPRFVLANVANQDLCYRQQGTETYQCLPKGKQAHLRWSDMSRPLLVCVRFDQHGWDWSGAFVPEQLGDTQLKMRNLVTGATQILRAEVQSSLCLESEFVGISSTDNSLGTYLIFLSDDDSGFMPYRIDNFSLERIRFYQVKCPDFESTLLPYSSCPYAWDEPWRPHQLVLEIPGEGRVGTFDLDEINDYPTILIPATNQKPERTFLVCVHAEGPRRVLSFQDLNLHPRKDQFGADMEGFTQPTKKNEAESAYNFNLSLPSVGISIIDTFPQEIVFALAREVIVELFQGPHEQKLSMNILYIQLDNQLPYSPYPVMFIGGTYIPSGNEMVDGTVGRALGGNGGPHGRSAFTMVVEKWRHLASSVTCFRKIDLRLAPAQIQLDEQIVSCIIRFVKNSNEKGYDMRQMSSPGYPNLLGGDKFSGSWRYELLLDPRTTQLHLIKNLKLEALYRSWPASWAVSCIQNQNFKAFLLARGGRKVYIEALFIAPIEVNLSFSSVPWTNKGAKPIWQSLWERGPSVQQSLMALFDIEGAPVELRQLCLAHPLARWDAIKGMVIRHYTRQLLHEIYKVLGSAGFLGNPMGFMKSVGSGVRDFVSAPAKSLQSPKKLVGGFAEGTQSLVNNTVFAVSNAATLISRAARKGVTTFALGHQEDHEFQDYGVISELLEGLTGLLQSPVTGAARHGLPGIFSGVAVGAVGVVARPVASILELAGRTAQSIRGWSQPIHQAKRIRPPRYLSRDCPLLPYSLEEAIGNAVLLEAASMCLQSEVYITCRPLLDPGKYVLLTERVLLIVRSASASHGARPGHEWIIDTEILLEDVLHVEWKGDTLDLLMGASRHPSRTRTSNKKYTSMLRKRVATSIPLLHESIQLARSEEAEELAACIVHLIEDLSRTKASLVQF